MTSYKHAKNRYLKDGDDFCSYNSWDDPQWTQDMIEDAEYKLELQRESCRDKNDIETIEGKIRYEWNQFYKRHKDRFFKDRKWILGELPELQSCLDDNSKSCKVLEVGCGVGNSIEHIKKVNKNTDLTIYCCDVAEQSLDLLARRYDTDISFKLVPIHADISTEFDEKVSPIIEEGSVDFVFLIFTLSAIKPELMHSTISNLASLLKNNGVIFLRDYAKYDLAQLRFKGSSRLGDNYYVRSDGTTTFFFETQFVQSLMSQKTNLQQIELRNDNRLLVNRAKGLKMFRRWIQAKYTKTIRPGTSVT